MTKARANDMPYWKSGASSPGSWLGRAGLEIVKAGGTMIVEALCTLDGNAAYMLRFELGGDMFKIVWPVLEPRRKSDLPAARRQAATMLYHDVKAQCLKSRVLGARVAFFSHLELPDGRSLSQLEELEVSRLLLTGAK